MKKINDKEYKKILTELLEFFNKICEENNINYTLTGGSLLGAIRHKGIIPWDDDIDVAVLPSEYDKLIKAFEKNTNDKYCILTHDNNPSYYFPFIKLIDKRTVVKDKNEKNIDDYGIFLDIFKLYNTSNNKVFAKIHYIIIKIFIQLINGYLDTTGGTRKKRFVMLKKIRNFISNKIGIDRLLILYGKVLRLYDNKNTDFVIGDWVSRKLENERFLNIKWLNLKI